MLRRNNCFDSFFKPVHAHLTSPMPLLISNSMMIVLSEGRPREHTGEPVASETYIGMPARLD